MTTPTLLLFTVDDIVIIDDKDKTYIIESRGETCDLFLKYDLFWTIRIYQM